MRHDSKAAREAMRRFYRIVGNYLAVYAWSHEADCVKIPQWYLRDLLGLRMLKGVSTKCFREDIKAWFPHTYPIGDSKSAGLGKPRNSLRLMYVSRIPIVFTYQVPVSTDGIIDFAPEPGVELTEAGILTHLTLMATGLKEPQKPDTSDEN